MKIIELLDKSVSYTVITKKYGIGKSTVSGMKKISNFSYLNFSQTQISGVGQRGLDNRGWTVYNSNSQ